MTLRGRALLVAFGAWCMGCNLFTDPAHQQLRIRNVGTAPLVSLTLFFPDTQIVFGNVAAGATTDYVAVPGGVYGYAAFTFTHADTAVAQPVIDWVGESPMTGQRFTYELTLTTMPNGSVWIGQSATKDP